MSVEVHASSVVDPKAELADGVVIGPFCSVGPDVKLGPRTKLMSHVVVDGHTTVGEDNVLYPFVMLGGPPQHTAYKGEPTQLVIGDRNVIREHATMNTGTVGGGGVTKVGSDGFYMIESHVGHDCIVGDQVILTKQATLGGHCDIADFVIVGGLAAVHQRTRVGRHAMVGGLAAVVKDVIPYGSVWGNHASLHGLNLIGLKRKGYGKDAVRRLLAAYRDMFEGEGLFSERLDAAAVTYADLPEIQEIIAFIREDTRRPVALPER